MNGPTHLTLRSATETDEQITWEWTNDPVVRETAFSKETIPLHVHARWFSEALEDPDRHLFIAEREGEPIGIIRFEREDGQAYTVSLSIQRSARGRGLAAPVLLLGLDALADRVGQVPVKAFVRPENAVSLRVFSRAGFLDAGMTSRRGSAARLLERTTDEGQGAGAASRASKNRSAPRPSTRP